MSTYSRPGTFLSCKESQTFHTQNKNRNNTLNNNIKRDIGRQILNGLWLQRNKWRETSKATYSTIFWKRHRRKCNDSLRDLQSRFFKEKNSSKGLKFKKNEEKPLKVPIVASFEGDDEKAQYASFKQTFV